MKTKDTDKSGKMRGGVRRRGATWSYVADWGRMPAQRCPGCTEAKRRPSRWWISGRGPLEVCPICGGTLHMTSERRMEEVGGFSTRKTAEQARHDVLSEMGRGERIVRDDMSVREFLESTWLPAIEGNIKASTYRSYAGHVRLFLAPYLGAKKLQQLQTRDIELAYAAMRKDRAEGAGRALSPSSVRRIAATAHRAFHDAKRWRMIAHNPADDVQLPPVERTERVVWNAQELRAFLATVAEDRLLALWQTYAASGCRRGELLSIRWRDVDMQAGQLRIKCARIKVGKQIIESTPKTERSARAIAIDADTIDALERLCSIQVQEAKLFAWELTSESYVFADETGQPLDPDRVTAEWQKAVKRSGLRRTRLHDLRHAHASLLHELGVPDVQISRRLGHSSLVVTHGVYVHWREQKDRESAETFGAAIFGTTAKKD